MRRLHGAARRQAGVFVQPARGVDGRANGSDRRRARAQGGKLDPLQQSFMEHDAPQCGFCTSGQLMSAKALLAAQSASTRPEEVRAAMTGNICRCSNYNRYVEARRSRPRLDTGRRPRVVIDRPMRRVDRTSSRLKTVGHATTRIDARERVTGKATYTGDVICPACCTRACCAARIRMRASSRSTFQGAGAAGRQGGAHARELHVRVGRGLGRGRRQYNDEIKKITKQRRYAFNNPVRFVGEPVAAVAAVDRHMAEEALRRITVDYEVLPFVLDPEEALKPGARADLARGQPVARYDRTRPSRSAERRGNVEEGFRSVRSRVRGPLHDCLRAQRADGAARVRGQLGGRQADRCTRPPAASPTAAPTWRATWAFPTENVRVICQYMGGNFGNKNQNQDADLIAAMLAKQAGAPVKLEMSRKEDFIGMHGRWPTMQYYKVGVSRDGTLQAHSTARLQRHGAVPEELGGDRRHRAVSVPATSRASIHPVYTNKTVSGNFRGPEFPQGFFGIQSMMDDVAYKLKMDPVDFVLKNMTRKANDETAYTNYTLEECIRRGAEAFEWKKRWRPQPGSDAGPVKRGAGMCVHGVPIGRGPQQRRAAMSIARASTRVSRGRHRRRRRREDHHGPDRGRGAGRAAFAGRSGLGRHGPLPVFGGRIRQPHHHHDRLRGDRSRARSEAPDRGERACRRASDVLTASANPNPDDRRRQGAQRLRRALRRSRGGHRSSATCASPSIWRCTTAAAS